MCLGASWQTDRAQVFPSFLAAANLLIILWILKGADYCPGTVQGANPHPCRSLWPTCVSPPILSTDYSYQQ